MVNFASNFEFHTEQHPKSGEEIQRLRRKKLNVIRFHKTFVWQKSIQIYVNVRSNRISFIVFNKNIKYFFMQVPNREIKISENEERLFRIVWNMELSAAP